MTDGPDPGDVTRLLQEIAKGNRRAESELVPLVYDELRRLASQLMRSERPGHTLQTTALVHEAYLRLVGQSRISWTDRGHFFAVAARMMRRLLVDHARARMADKRGAGLEQVDWPETGIAAPAERWDEILAVNEALDRLADLDARKAKIVELRFFGGLDANETAKALGVSVRTVHRGWDFAQTWLRSEMTGPKPPPEDPP